MQNDVTTEKAPDLGQVQNRTLTIREGLQARGIDTDEQGRKIFTALAYGYDDGTPETIDTYGTTMARGAMAHVTPDDFRILQYHQQGADPVGKPISIEDTSEGPLVRFVFADSPRAQEMQSLVEGGFIRGVSVGFMPTDGYQRKDGTIVYTKADLHELSLVNAPSSKKALIDLTRDLGADPDAMAELYKDVVREATPAEQIRDIALAVTTRAAAGDNTDVLATALQLASIADTALDLLQDMLSDALGVENPDDAQDAALEAGDDDAEQDDAVGGFGMQLDAVAEETIVPETPATVADVARAISARAALRRTRR